MSAIADYLALIDWNADGDYDDSGDDVTSRLRTTPAITMTRGRDGLRQLSPPMAGELTLVLDNKTKDYSPENGSSPLAGNLLPRRSVRIWATRFRMDFNTDGTGAGAVDVGETTLATGAGWSRSGGALQKDGVTGAARALSGATVDGRWQARMKGILNSATDYAAPYLLFRYLEANNHLYVRLLDSYVGLRKVDGGVDSAIVGAATTTADDTYYVVMVEALGNVIKVYVDGALQFTHTLTGGDTKYSGATYELFGMQAKKLGTPASDTCYWDYYYVYTPQTTCLIDDFIPHPEYENRSVELSCLGSLSQLTNLDEAQQGISTALYADITTDVALGYLLDAVGLTDTSKRVFDTGEATLSWWWLHKEDPFRAMAALLATEGPGSVIYEDGWGRIVFKSRYHRMTEARCTTSVATFSDTGAEPLHSPPFTYNPALKDIINVATIEHKLRTKAGAVSVVWTLGSTLSLGANEVREILAVDDDPFTEAVTPVGAIDYTVTQGAVYSLTLNRTSGQSATIIITAAGQGVTITGLQLRAKTVPVTTTTQVRTTCDTSTSQTRYGVRSYPVPVRAEIGINAAQDLVNAISRLYEEPRPTVEITVNNADRARLGHGLSREISDRVTIVEGQSSISADCFIERIKQIPSEGGKSHVTQFGCEKVRDTSYAIYGTSVYGTGVYGY